MTIHNRNMMRPMTIPTSANNKKADSEKVPTKVQDFNNKKMARVDDRSYIYVPANATQEEVAELVEKARKQIHHLKNK